MAVVKSEIIKQLKKSYPNFEYKLLSKIVEIIIKEIMDSLKRSESFELRGFGRLSTKIQKAGIRRNPKTNQKVSVSSKRVIRWKMSKELFRKLNNDKE